MAAASVGEPRLMRQNGKTDVIGRWPDMGADTDPHGDIGGGAGFGGGGGGGGDSGGACGCESSMARTDPRQPGVNQQRRASAGVEAALFFGEKIQTPATKTVRKLCANQPRIHRAHTNPSHPLQHHTEKLRDMYTSALRILGQNVTHKPILAQMCGDLQSGHAPRCHPVQVAVTDQP